jgi:hypothetical protein
MHAIDADVAAYFVKINVTGLSYRVVQVDLAMTFGFPVAIAMCAAGQAVIADTNGSACQVGCAGLERSERQHWLDGRAGRIGTSDSAVEQRAPLVVLQFIELAGAHAGRERIRVERWRTHQCQDLAVARINCHNRAPPILESLGGDSLQIEIEAEIQVVSRCRRIAFQQ